MGGQREKSEKDGPQAAFDATTGGETLCTVKEVCRRDEGDSFKHLFRCDEFWLCLIRGSGGELTERALWNNETFQVLLCGPTSLGKHSRHDRRKSQWCAGRARYEIMCATTTENCASRAK